MVTAIDSDLDVKLKSGSSSPIYLVELQLSIPYGIVGPGVDDDKYNIKFCSGDRPLRNVTRDVERKYRVQKIIPNIVLAVGEISQEVNALSRSCTIANTSIILTDDGTLRDILVDPGVNDTSTANISPRHLYGQKVTIYLGTQDIDISKFFPIGNYTIEEIMPTSNTIELQCRSQSAILASLKLTRSFIARDPYTQMDQILRHSCALGDLQYDRESVDPYWQSIPENDHNRRHLSLRRATEVIDSEFLSSSKAPNGEDPWRLLQDICYITGGFIYSASNGKITYKPWDPDKVASRHLTTDDIRDFSQDVTYANMTNRVTHTVTADQLGIAYNPYNSNIETQTGGASAGPTSQAAYFGGNAGDTHLTLQDEDAARLYAHFDSRYMTTNSPYKDVRWLETKADLRWESGMGFTPWLMARTITYSGSVGEITTGYPVGAILDQGSSSGAGDYLCICPTMSPLSNQHPVTATISTTGKPAPYGPIPFGAGQSWLATDFYAVIPHGTGDLVSLSGTPGGTWDIPANAPKEIHFINGLATFGSFMESAVQVGTSGTPTPSVGGGYGDVGLTGYYMPVDTTPGTQSSAVTMTLHHQTAAGTTPLGRAKYDHSTKKITLQVGGHINISNPLSPDYIGFSPSRGVVIRIVPKPQDLANAIADGCAYKEARIQSIDNTSGPSILTLADDQVLEFDRSFPATFTALTGEVFPTYQSTTLRGGGAWASAHQRTHFLTELHQGYETKIVIDGTSYDLAGGTNPITSDDVLELAFSWSGATVPTSGPGLTAYRDPVGYDWEIIQPEKPTDNMGVTMGLTGTDSRDWPGPHTSGVGMRVRRGGEPWRDGWGYITLDTTGFQVFAQPASGKATYVIECPGVGSHFAGISPNAPAGSFGIRAAFTTPSFVSSPVNYDITYYPGDAAYGSNARVITFSTNQITVEDPVSLVTSGANITEAGKLYLIYSKQMVLDTQRYFYIQYAAHTGFAGAGYGAGPFELNAESPHGALSKVGATGPGLTYQVGPGYQEAANLTPGGGGWVGYADMRLCYGHYPVGNPTGASEGTHFAQLRGQEWADRVGDIGIGGPRYAYIKLESSADRRDAAGWNAAESMEVIKCNLSYPCSSTYSSQEQYVDHTGNTVTLDRYIHRKSTPQGEPGSNFNIGVVAMHGASPYASCAVFRTEAESVTELPMLYKGSLDQKGGGLKASGRGALESELAGSESIDEEDIASRGVFWAPQAWESRNPNWDPEDRISPPNIFFMGIKATDVTSAVIVNERILSRCSEGMPVLTISTSLEHIDLELGDFITIASDIYLRINRNGADTSDVFEVVRKEIFIEEDSPKLEFQLAWVREGVAAYIPPKTTYEPKHPYGIDIRSMLEFVVDNTGSMLIDIGGSFVAAQNEQNRS